MSLIPLLLIKHAYDQAHKPKHRDHSSSTKGNVYHAQSYGRREYSREEILDNKRSSIYPDYSQFDKLLIELINNNPEIQGVLVELLNGYKDMKEEDKKAIEQQLFAVAPNAESAADELYQSMRTLIDMGFELSYDKQHSLSYTYQNDSSRGYGYKNIDCPDLFNGCSLTMEDVQTGKNPYLVVLQSFENENPNCEQTLLNVKSRIAELEKNKVMLYLSKERQLELERLKQEAERLTQLVERLQLLRQRNDKYINLSLEEKSALLNYFEKESSMSEISEQIAPLRSRLLMIDGYYNRYDRAATQQYDEYSSSVVSKSIAQLGPDKLEYLRGFMEMAVESISNMSEEDMRAVIDGFNVYPVRVEVGDKLIPNEIINLLSDNVNRQVMTQIKNHEQGGM